MAIGIAVTRLTETLRDSGLAWLLPNLRQDFLVWNTLIDPGFLDLFLQSRPTNPMDYSPGKLAQFAKEQADLMTLEQYHEADINRDQTQSDVRSVNKEQSAVHSANNNLINAGLAAREWQKNYYATKSWNGLIKELLEEPKRAFQTPIACLFGYLEHPIELLRGLICSGCSSGLHQLAVHAILSNPLTINDQTGLLINLCHDENGILVPPSDRVLLVKTLHEQNPRIAEIFCTRWLEIYPDYSSHTIPRLHNTIFQLNDLLENHFQSVIRQIAGKEEESVNLLGDELAQIQSLYCHLSNQIVERKPFSDVENIGRPGITEIGSNTNTLDSVLNTAKNQLINQAELALILARRGNLEAARTILLAIKKAKSEDVVVQFAIATISHVLGDDQQAWTAASGILNILNQQPVEQRDEYWAEYFSLADLGKLLMDLGKYEAAAQIFERAIRDCPNDANLLARLANGYKAIHQNQKAAETLNSLVSLYPENLDFHRDYARSLEQLEDWLASLNERSLILDPNNRYDQATTLEDKYEYAHCAIEANQPGLAISTCNEILAQNQADSEALILAGEAYLRMGQVERGMEFLTLATQVTPPVAKAWLALGEAQKKIYPLHTVIETLKNASLLLPGSSQIHHSLGVLYSQDNELTLALPEFAASVELSPDNPQYLVGYGEILQRLGHIPESRRILSKAFQEKPEFPDLARLYAKILIDLGEIEDAIPPLEILINSDTGQDHAPYLDYARCVLAINKSGKATYPPMKALMALNQLLQIDPKNAEAKALTAEALTANGENELAFQAYREALETSLSEDKEWFERLSYGFGCVSISIGKYDTAIAALQEASQVNPNNPDIFMALSDAYQYAKLPEDATRSARSVLIIDGENPDRLAWFARQVAKINSDRKPEPFVSTTSIPKEDVQEGMSALLKAIQLEPTRTDLMIQLGNFQSLVGERSAARATFASITSLDFATTDDLLIASKYLSENNDHTSAISCLEKCILLDRHTDQKHDPELYIRLAQEYVYIQSLESAFNTLDRALEILPNDQLIITKKVELLLGSGKSTDALCIIETAIKEGSSKQQFGSLYFIASEINRSMGNLPAAVKYARMGVEAQNTTEVDGLPTLLSYRDRINIAELDRALLQPDHGIKILQTMSKLDKSEFIHEQDYLNFIFLHTELALESGDPLHPGIQDVKLEPSHPSFSRCMAINARLLNKAGNYTQAVRLLEIALSNWRKIEESTEIRYWTASHSRYLNLNALMDASLDLGWWEQAISLGQLIVETSPDAPIAQLNLARVLILEAEYRHLCDSFDVTKNNPSEAPDSPNLINRCTQYLDQAKMNLVSFHGENIIADQGITDDQIYRWQARFEIVFRNGFHIDDDPVSALAKHVTPGDIAAAIHCLIEASNIDDGTDNLNRIIKLARNFPRNPTVMLQVALALHEKNPEEAMKSLISVLEHNPYAKNPHIAFCNFQLAKLGVNLNRFDIAKKAIDSALSFWQDEPGWHELAGQIYYLTNDLTQAIIHFKEAANLAPQNIAYQLELGKVLFDNAGDDASVVAQSVASFEKALTLDPENVYALRNLANAHHLLGDYDQAEAFATSALGLIPDQVELYQLLSEIALKKNDYQGAYKYASKALQNSPKDIHSSIMLARSLSSMGRNDEALTKINTIIPMVQDAQPLLLERIDILRKVNGPQIALKELKALAEAYPDDFNILDALSKSFFEVGELESAVATAQQALRIKPETVCPIAQANLHLMIGRVFRKTGQLDQAIQHFCDAIQLAPNRLEPYLELGMARKEQREYGQALQVFERATVIAPNDPRAPFQAGLALKESKDYKSSESMLRRAVSLAPNDLTIRRQLAAVVALNLIHNPRSARTNTK